MDLSFYTFFQNSLNSKISGFFYSLVMYNDRLLIVIKFLKGDRKMKNRFSKVFALLVLLGSVPTVFAEIKEIQKERGGTSLQNVHDRVFVWMDSKYSRQSCSVSLKTAGQRCLTYS